MKKLCSILIFIFMFDGRQCGLKIKSLCSMMGKSGPTSEKSYLMNYIHNCTYHYQGGLPIFHDRLQKYTGCSLEHDGWSLEHFGRSKFMLGSHGIRFKFHVNQAIFSDNQERQLRQKNRLTLSVGSRRGLFSPYPPGSVSRPLPAVEL